MIPNSFLNYFLPLNTVNVHPSLLPKYRGAAPIQWAIINGDTETGVTVQSLSRNKFDCGLVFAQQVVVGHLPDHTTSARLVLKHFVVPRSQLDKNLSTQSHSAHSNRF